MKTVYLIIIVLLFTTGCIEKHEKVNLSVLQRPDIKENDTAVKAAIASAVSQTGSYEHYEELIQYISKKLGGDVKLAQKRSCQEVNELIRNKQIDFAFVCSGAYVEGSSEFGMKLLVAPRMYGRTTYNSYIIVLKNSSFNALTDLQGKRFAFSDPLSNSGKLYPTYRLSLINQTPESFFGVDENGRNNYFYTYSSDYSIIAVAEGLADGAAVDSLAYEYMNDTEPDIISKIRILDVSPPFGIPPVIVPKDIDPFLEQKLKDIFLNMDKDEESRAILSKIMINKFININDSAYDSIRDMRKKIK